jgi:hypothetical protein
MVQYALPIELYFKIWGAACWRVFTVSTECMIKSPDDPPIAPANAAWVYQLLSFEWELHAKWEGSWLDFHLAFFARTGRGDARRIDPA